MTTEREHAEKDCWCQPFYLRECPECDGRGEGDDRAKAKCWMCKGGGLLRCEKTHDQAFAVHVEFEFEADEDGHGVTFRVKDVRSDGPSVDVELHDDEEDD